MNFTFSSEGFIPLKCRLEQFQCPMYTANSLPLPHPFSSPQPPFFQKTGVHLFVSLTLAHTPKYPDTWVSVQGRSAGPLGNQWQDGVVRPRGWRGEAVGEGCQPFREPQKNLVWNRDPPTDRDGTQLRGCSVTDKLHSPSFQTPSLCLQTRFFSLSLFVVHLSDFLQLNLLARVATKTTGGWWIFLFFLFFLLFRMHFACTSIRF